MNYKTQLAALGGASVFLGTAYSMKNQAIYKVDVGC